MTSSEHDRDVTHDEAVAGLKVFLAAAVVVALVIGLYVVWLGWNTPKSETSPGTFEGPFLWWQVLGLLASLAVVTAAAAWVVADRVPAVAAAVAVYVLAAVDEATRPGYADPSFAQVLLVVLAVGLGAVLHTLADLAVGVRSVR